MPKPFRRGDVATNREEFLRYKKASDLLDPPIEEEDPIVAPSRLKREAAEKRAAAAFQNEGAEHPPGVLPRFSRNIDAFNQAAREEIAAITTAAIVRAMTRRAQAKKAAVAALMGKGNVTGVVGAVGRPDLDVTDVVRGLEE